MLLTPVDFKRYDQQLKLNEIGISGQEKIKNARVLCVGAGGLAASLLLYLTGAGVGSLGIVDDDRIELSNLSRQVLYQQNQVGQSKALAAKQQLNALNSSVNIQAYPERLNTHNVEYLLTQYDFIADCSDNLTTRYLINDAAYSANKPYVYAAVAQLSGQCAVFSGNSCLRCLFPLQEGATVVPACTDAGVLGMLPGILGLIQATEVIKLIVNINSPLRENLLTVNLRTLQFQQIRRRKNKDCPLCSIL